jgi:hypothetical protein
MKKQKLLGIIAIVTIIASMTMIGCGGNTHTCEFSGWEITTPAT